MVGFGGHRRLRAALKEVEDLVDHYETRSATQPGKALVVTMSRDICVRLYDEIVALRPDWHSDEHSEGKIKVVMTASASDKPHLQPHHTNKSQRKTSRSGLKTLQTPCKL